MPEYQFDSDRPSETETIDDLLDVAEAIATEMGAAHFDECYNHPLCAACIEVTPISQFPGLFVADERQFEQLVEEVISCEPRVEGEMDPDVIDQIVRSEYLDAFEMGTKPQDCAACTKRIISEEAACGHERNGGDCPV